MENLSQIELTKEFFEEFSQAVANKDENFIRQSLAGLRNADISLLLEEFDAEHSKYVLQLLPVEVSAAIIKDLDEDVQQEFLEFFSSEEIAAYIDVLETDNGADILNELPAKKREEVIAHLSNFEKANHILELLRYEENCAGGLMAKELVKVSLNWSVIRCIEEIRQQAEGVEKIYSVYVVDENDKLLGRVSLKNLLLSNTKAMIRDIYDPDIVSVQTYMYEEEVAAIMQKYDLEVVPVVNIHGKLVGRITVDDIIDVIREIAEEERQIMAGLSEDVEEDDSVWILSRARLPWLVIGLIGGMLGAKLIGVFERDLAEVTAVAFFIPLIMATGGNVGIQSSALVVQGLANPIFLKESLWRRILKVLLVALLNGLVLALLIYLFVFLTNSAELALVVSLALLTVVVLASVLGTIIPIVLDKLGFNPALASGPFITTTNDLLGLTIYFTSFHLLYNYV